jgi:FkbM family methyltransferase
VILDVGAAEGLFALSVIERCKKIIMIEPNDFFYNSLRKTFKDYGQKVKIYNVAVGNTEGQIVFDQTSLSGHIDHNNQKGTKKVITKIDSLLQNESEITYLKADLEGYEMEMLRGASQTIKKHTPKIAITTYHSENNSLEIIAFIRALVPEYKFYTKGIFHQKGKPIMVHFWIPEAARS